MAALAPLLATAALALIGTALPAQLRSSDATPRGELLRAAMQVTLDPAGTALEVRIRYELHVPAGANGVPVAAVLFAGAAIENPSADDSPVTLEGGRRLTGMLPLQPSDTARELAIAVAYRVHLASALRSDASPAQRVRVPVLALLWPPAEATPGRFSVDIAFPSGWRARPVFPADAQAGSAAGGAPRLHAGLAVVPALIAFDIGAGDGTGFVFWGLFVAFLAIVLLYTLWMARTERR